MASSSPAEIRYDTTQVVDHAQSPILRGVMIRACDVPASPSERLLNRGSIVLGAGLGADMVISNDSVSRRHLQVTVSNHGVEIVDLNSRNGTYFQGQRVGRLTLDREATIALGRANVTLSPQVTTRVEPSSEVIEELESQPLSGNVRELCNVIRAYAELGELPKAPIAGEEHLAELLRRVLDMQQPYQQQKDHVLNQFIDVYLSMLLDHTGGNQSEAARVSGIDRAHLNKMIAKLRRESKHPSAGRPVTAQDDQGPIAQNGPDSSVRRSR